MDEDVRRTDTWRRNEDAWKVLRTAPRVQLTTSSDTFEDLKPYRDIKTVGPVCKQTRERSSVPDRLAIGIYIVNNSVILYRSRCFHFSQYVMKNLYNICKIIVYFSIYMYYICVVCYITITVLTYFENLFCFNIVEFNIVFKLNKTLNGK